MSHNSRCYAKKIDKKTSSTCKRIDLLFRQASMAKKPRVDTEECNLEVEETATGSCSKSPQTQSTSGPQSLAIDEPIAASHSSPSLVSASPNRVESDISDTDSDVASAAESDGQQVMVPDSRLYTSAKYETRHPWLYYSAAKGMYLCKVCEMFSSTTVMGTFATGVRGLGVHPTRKLCKHESSKEHARCLETKTGPTSRRSVLDLLHDASEKLGQRQLKLNREYFADLITTTYFIIRRKWALDSVGAVMEHMAGTGNTKILDYAETNPNRPYTSATSISQIVSCIDKYLEQDVLEKVRASGVFTLLADESSDEGKREQFAILIRQCQGPGDVKEQFLGITEVKKQDAQTLMTAIEEFLIKKTINIKNAIFVGFDGCNVMSGENKGLQRRFRHVVPHQLYVNCRNHKLALCIKHLIKQYPSIETVDSLLLAIWKLFHFSPRNYQIFQAVQESYGMTKLKFLKASTTCWLSHGKSCQRLINRFEQVIDALDASLDDKYVPEVFGLRHQLLEKSTIAMVLILCDILRPVILFSDYLQGSNVFSDMQTRCRELIDQLHHLVARFTACVNRPDDDLYLSRMDDLFQTIDDRTELARRMRGPGALTTRQVVEEVALPVTYSLINEISDAFNCSPVLAAFSVFNMQNVPENMTEIGVYGEREIGILASHYGRPKEDTYQGHRTLADPVHTEANIKAQYQGFKHQICLSNCLLRRVQYRYQFSYWSIV